MARLEPFPGIRYAVGGGVLDDLVAPPYDVISEDERARLEARSAHNAVRVELPRDEGGRSRYEEAAHLFDRWRGEGVLVADPPSLYVYRMRYADEGGRRRSTIGVIGALGLRGGDGDEVLPHERTTPKDKADRLEILRATGVNLSPIWGLSQTAGLSSRLEALTGAAPEAVATDDAGVVHELWRVDDHAAVEGVGAAVASAPVLVADGHHRLEVAVAHLAEADGTARPGAEAIMAYVVELVDEQLLVQAVHRLVGGVAPAELLSALAAYFGVEPLDGPLDVGILSRMTEAGALCLLAAVQGVEVRYQHGFDEVRAAVDKGDADAAVLLRPATVAQIAQVSRGGARMPPKTTFFSPKPRTGMVFRSLAG